MSNVTHEFVKVETRLLNDPRFFTLPEQDQLIWLKILMLCKMNQGRIPSQTTTFCALLRTNRDANDIDLTIERLKAAFPKFKSTKHFHYVQGFQKRHDNKSLQNELMSRKSRVEKSRVEYILQPYLQAKNISTKDLSGSDWGRLTNAVKKLLKRTNDDKLVCAAIEWTNNDATKRGYQWTLETVDKKWLDFIASDKQSGGWDTPMKIESDVIQP